MDEAISIADNIDPSIMKVSAQHVKSLTWCSTCVDPVVHTYMCMPDTNNYGLLLQDLRLLYILKTRKFVELLRPRKDYALLAALGMHMTSYGSQRCTGRQMHALATWCQHGCMFDRAFPCSMSSQRGGSTGTHCLSGSL